ncbi:MAG: three-Cys-motif partner protein TcmP, partial [Pseudomonadales bacterium]
AGPGKDADGQECSPLILLRQINEYADQIRKNRIKVRLMLNEGRVSKARTLQRVMEEQKIPPTLLDWKVHNLPFPKAFDLLYTDLTGGNNLLFLDQQGMKFTSDAIFHQVIALERTDFIFFIASSSIRRFQNHPSFKKHLQIPEQISARAFTDTHRAITDYYRNIIPNGSDVLLAPFSLKKRSNIYGVIFGSSHPLGMEKFLRVCWEMDVERGEANFDIDGDSLDPMNPLLFPEWNVTQKLKSFQQDLRGRILDGSVRSDGAVYFDCLQCGMLPKHGKDVIRQLIKSQHIKITSGHQPRVSIAGWKDPRALEVTNNGNF